MYHGYGSLQVRDDTLPAHDIILTSVRRHYVASTSVRRHVFGNIVMKFLQVIHEVGRTGG